MKSTIDWSRRLPAAELNKVGPHHVHEAVEKLVGGDSLHPFGESTDFDLLLSSGKRLPPKAVFGLAAKTALGHTVLPHNFSGGLGTPCFRILEHSGYKIVAKGETTADGGLLGSEDRAWAEGQPKLVTHLRRERAPGLAEKKKAAFLAKHNKLFCERCKMDPVQTYGGPIGAACIEVHHSAVHVTDMKEGHATKLIDLQCLCANCHRLVHAKLKQSLSTP